MITLFTLIVCNIQTVGDPRNTRGTGTQSEVPILRTSGEKLSVSGYQIFDVYGRNLERINVIHYKKKFDWIFDTLSYYYWNKGCRTMVDIGCSAGLTTLLATKVGYNHITSLDHDREYINILNGIVRWANTTNVHPSVIKEIHLVLELV